MHLTAAGQQLIDDAPALLASFDSTLRHVRQLGRGVERLAIAFAPGLRVSEPIRAFSADHPDVQIELFQVDWWDHGHPTTRRPRRRRIPATSLQGGRLHVVAIGQEPTVVLMPATHRLARRRALAAADPDGEKVLNSENRHGCITEEKCEQIIVANAVAVLPLTAAASIVRPGLTYIAVEDSAPFDTCLAVLEGRREGDLHRAFMTTATGVLRGTTALEAVDDEGLEPLR